MGAAAKTPEPGAALFGKTRRQLLGLFFGHPEEWIYLRQAARRSGAGLGAVQRELARLTAAGILRRRTQGRQVYYQANAASPLFPELKSLVAKSVGLAEVLAAALAPLAARLRLAFIFGSLAQGRGGPESDVDLMVVGRVSAAQLVRALGPAQERLGREINPVVFPVSEFRAKAREDGRFVRSVLNGPKLFVVGGEDELNRLF